MGAWRRRTRLIIMCIPRIITLSDTICYLSFVNKVALARVWNGTFVTLSLSYCYTHTPFCSLLLYSSSSPLGVSYVDNWQCLETLSWLEGKAVTGIQWTDAKGGVKHPKLYRTVAHDKQVSSPECHSATVEKASLRGNVDYNITYHINIIKMYFPFI